MVSGRDPRLNSAYPGCGTESQLGVNPVSEAFPFPDLCPEDPNLGTRELWQIKVFKKLLGSWSPISILMEGYYCYSQSSVIKPTGDPCSLHPDARHVGLLESQGFGDEQQSDTSGSSNVSSSCIPQIQPGQSNHPIPFTTKTLEHTLFQDKCTFYIFPERKSRTDLVVLAVDRR